MGSGPELRVDRLCAELTRAVARRDAAEFRRLVDPAVPAFAALARMVFDNLEALQLTTFSVTPTAQRPAAATPSGAVDQQVVVRWAVPGDMRPAEHVLRLTVAGSDDVGLLAGIRGAGGGRQEPIWLLEPVHAVHSGTATVVAASSEPLGRWVSAAVRASAAVGRERNRTPTSLVLEVPANTALLEEMLGGRPGSYDAFAALTWPEGTDAASAALRIVVNPSQARSMTSTGLNIVLTHEATHVATASPGSPLPLWMVEGYADYVAYDVYPAAQDDAAAPLLDRVRDGQVPRSLPGNADFADTATDLDDSYAEAWLAFRYLAATYGSDAVAPFYARTEGSFGGDVTLSMPVLLHTDLPTFTRGWRHYLTVLAARR